MAIAYNNSTTLSCPTDTTVTTTLAVTANANRYAFATTTAATSDVSFDGVAMTKLNFRTITSNGGFDFVPNVTVWGLANPSSGTKTLSATTVGGADSICFAVYDGVDQVQPEAYNTNQTNGNAVSGQTDTITTITANAWLATFIAGTGNPGRVFVAGASTTLRQTNGTYSYPTGILDSGSAKVTPGSYSLVTSWTSSTGWLSSITYSLKPYLTFGFSGPASGNVNAASTNFTVTPNVAINGTVTITPSGVGSTGLSPTILTFSNSAVAQTFTITPLTSGAITLTMTNGVGLNNPSPLTYTANAVAPGIPTIGTATPGNTNASITFSAPASNGGSAITQYRAISTPGSFVNTGLTSPIVVSGLTNGVAYTFTVRATNIAGNSAESSASNSATPYVAATTFTFTGPSSGNVRSASTNFTVTPNAIYFGTITITPTGAGSSGLSPIVLTFSSASAQTFTITPTASGSITLTPTNNNGLSNPSNLTYTANAVVPLAPSIGLATPSIGSANVTVSAPSNDGGSAITSYTITSSPGAKTGSLVAPGTATILGLTNGVSYTFTATATNAIGTSSASSASNSVVPTASPADFTNSGPKFNIDRGVGNLITF